MTVIQNSDVQAIEKKMSSLRQTPDSERPQKTTEIALAIRKLPGGNEKVNLANGLANLSTEGDFGHNTLQEVATTLSLALAEQPQPSVKGEPAFAYMELAQLVRYEHVRVSLDDLAFKAAQKAVALIAKDQAAADFTLQDITGKSWTRSALTGKVVLVNFWATWCPPCRKEMPDLEKLYQEFKDRGLVVLAISDEKGTTVKPFIEKARYTFPVLLDPNRATNTTYHIAGIPNSFLYDRSGRLVAQAIDMRTRGQFLKMFATAGLK
jgi:peroxiredoxin